MKSIFLYLIIIIQVISCKSGPRNITLTDVKNYYGELFSLHVEKRDKEIVFYFEEKKLPSHHPLYKLSKDFVLYFDYLLSNYTTIMKEIFESKVDTAEADKKFIELLKKDSLFNSQFLPVVYLYLKSKNITITDYAYPLKQKIKKQELFTTASRFFYAFGTDTIRRTFNWYVCVGKNPYFGDTSLKKFPAGEAFSVMTLLNSKYRRSRLFKDFDDNIEKITIECRQIDGIENKLNYARKRMPEEMVKSESLRVVLWKEYERHKEVLPFIAE